MSIDGEQIDTTVDLGGEVEQAPAEVSQVEAGGAVQETVESPSSSSEEPAQPVVNEGSDKFSSLMDSLGDVPEELRGTLQDKMTPEVLAKLPDEARGTMRILWDSMQQAQRAQEAKYAEREKQFEAKMQEIENAQSDLIRSRAQYAQMFKNPAFQDMLKISGMSEEEMSPIDTPEGQMQRLQKMTAETFEKFSKPIKEAQIKVEKQAAFDAFKSSHPMMKDQSFVKEMSVIMKERQDQGNPVSWEDGYRLTRDHIAQKEAERTERIQRKKRAEAARQSNKSTISTRTGDGELLPTWLKTKGYKGYTGSAARNLFLLDNPDIAKKISKR